MSGHDAKLAERILILAPTEADALLSESILGRAGLEHAACADFAALHRELALGAGAILLTEELLSTPDASRLLHVLQHQPAWSDLPTVLLSSSGIDSPSANLAMEALGNVTVLERPVRVTTLVSALRSAVRARRRQYELRDQIGALRKSEERFHIVAQTVHESIWDFDVATGRFWSSELTRPLFGHGPELTPGLDAWRARRHPDDAERVRTSFEAALAGTDSTWMEEYRFRRIDGTYVEILDRGHILRDSRGAAVRVVGAMLDMSERKRAEEVRALHAAIVQTSADAIVSKSLDGIILSWNGGAERLFGYSAREAIGQPITLIIPPELREEEASLIDEIRHGRRVEHFETVRRARDGREVVISLTLSPLLDSSGRVIGASKVARDVTARRRAEDTMRKQAQRLRLLLEAAASLLTSDNSEVMMRAMFARIGEHLGLGAYAHWRVDERGLQLESSHGIPEDALAAIADLPAHTTAPVTAILQEAGLPTTLLVPLVAEGRQSGSLLFASPRRAPFDPDEEEFLRTIAHYVTSAGERVRLIEQLRDSDRRKDEFLATLAHELRNPLAPVRSNLEIMRLSDGDGLELGQARETMERQIGQMVRLIDDLLDVSRITRGRLELRTEPIDLATVIRTSVETARPLIDEAGHRLIVEAPEAPIALMADPVRLAQVLSNLLNNAAKYTERGGTIRLSTVLEGDTVAITVTDTGVGIAAESLPGVFDLFQQLNGTLERSQGGLGIGLTLVKRLVEMHGGNVRADSAGPGQGSVFTVRLPVIVTAAGKAPVPAGASEDARPAGRRILVADDNRDAAESLARLLRMMGNEVRTVHDGAQAVAAAGAFEPEVVLLDIGMPVLNGYDAARQMREAPNGQDLVLVALTGWGQDDDKRKAIDAGFDLHFTKPLEPSDLGRIVQMQRAASSAPVPEKQA